MKKLFFLLLTAIAAVVSSCSQKTPDGFVLVKGGAFVNTRSKYYDKPGTIPDLYVGKYEVTQKEWADVMKNNPSKFKGDNLPVEMVNWYDCIDYCNKRSIKDGLKPYYNIDKNKKDRDVKNNIDTIRWTVTINQGANGYRLPTNAEWDYAAGGGQLSKNYLYSGSDNIDEVAWYWKNSGDKYLSGSWSWAVLVNNHNKTKPVGSKKPNELGLYDMSGNVREWCWDRHPGKGTDDAEGRIWAGGGWLGGDFCCVSSYLAAYEASGKGPDQGLRICRSE
ncbi:formylglycine-generating enzyme family protein [Mucilaginibacter sp. AW1-3]